MYSLSMLTSSDEWDHKVAEINNTLRYYWGICIVVNLLGILDFSGIRDLEISMFGVRVIYIQCYWILILFERRVLYVRRLLPL
jgi:hypothetical protein